MENKINIAELLKDCPTGMELDCTMYDSVTLLNVNDREDITFPIKVLREDGNYIPLTKYGQYTYADFAKCVIYPKGKTTWEGFQRPFKDGDVVFSGVDLISIYKEQIGGHFGRLHSHVSLSNSNIFAIDGDIWTLEGLRLATEEEKKKLFDAIKENGYRWNPETKTLEKVIEPKFKVGDKIRHKINNDIYEISAVYDGFYGLVDYAFMLNMKYQDDYELASNKFDVTTLQPFDKVLVRGFGGVWGINIFGFYDGNNKECPFYCIGQTATGWNQCVPYWKNEHLLGTTDDCDEHFKTW